MSSQVLLLCNFIQIMKHSKILLETYFRLVIADLSQNLQANQSSVVWQINPTVWADTRAGDSRRSNEDKPKRSNNRNLVSPLST